MSELYYEALIKCGDRYVSMLSTFIVDNECWGWNDTKTTSENASVLWMFVGEFIQGCNDKLPLMKLNRWLGYIQGTLIQWEVTTVEDERNWTRPLFRPLDFENE